MIRPLARRYRTNNASTPIQVSSLSSIQSQTNASYTYNGDGLRMSKTVNGTADAFSWDLAEGLPLMLQDGGTQFVDGPGGMPIEQVSSSGTVTYLYQDQLGSTRVLADSSGNVVGTYSYDAFGTTTSHTGIATTSLQFAGQYLDAETGLYYLQARYYDPSTAQFINVDPLENVTGQPYSYDGDNPVNAADPMGLCGTCSGEGSAGPVGGLAHQLRVGLYNHSGLVAAVLGMAAILVLVLFSAEAAAAIAVGVGIASLIAGVLAVIHNSQHRDWGHLVIGVLALLPGAACVGFFTRAFRLAKEMEELGVTAWDVAHTGNTSELLGVVKKEAGVNNLRRVQDYWSYFTAGIAALAGNAAYGGGLICP